MVKKLNILGAFLALVGAFFVAAGLFAYSQVAAGQHSLDSFAAAENVQLSYDENGNLLNHGDATEGQDVLNLLENDWGYSVVQSDLNPNDPVVNTATEYMVQMAAIAYDVLNMNITVTPSEDTEYNGQALTAGQSYDIPVDGRYWADFDYTNPIDQQVRAGAWSGTAHALIAELGVGSVTASTLQLGTGISAFIGGLGLVFIVLGAAAVWFAAGIKKESAAAVVADDKELVNA
ncbi:hypothetical protein RN607_01750 [Demequina capsici]|uniref:Uncharacterized protein n=1 Tax=Demequina capsici TaxID=3075620 RepID=A0AA96F7E2_9MICO|nr:MULTISPECIES: hypothetical protein [unclassified Demequina]WNM24847.1 hypothetical protein RN606_01475 [Demequina sp. OYTSA14]WNM27754.1 hypothetical protein RN607_01750 [Demequina sp. PMTSA13]